MKISYNWLKEYIKADLTPEKTSEILTSIGLEVESLEKSETIKGDLEGVVVGEVLTCEKHPDADKLSLTTVDVGTGEALQIVCGAPNVAKGQKVLVATVGTTLYPTGSDEGFKIKRSKIRGVESLGMICAEDELGIGTDHNGIIVLPGDAVAGTPAMQQLKIEEDYTLEIGLTPNRIDAGSHYGVARDLAAYLKSQGEKVLLSLPQVSELKKEADGAEIAVTVENSEAAPRYMGVTVSGVTIAPSPEWLQTRLRAIGINPKNNVVDITNFILHETGQPLHAFDAGKIEGGKIVVRTCPEGTPFITLDEVERKLSASDLMICSAERPMCLAGVFGGLDSGVTDTTTDVFIESAYFNPVWVRKSAKRHGLNTDSSFRFERGVDPDMTPYALHRAAALIRELAGGKITSEVTDLYPHKIEPFRVTVSYRNINRLIGKEIPEAEVKNILAALDIAVESEKDGVLEVVVAPYRVDVQREADVIEEILRIYGYNNIDVPQHVNSTLSYVQNPDKEKLANIASDFLSAGGYNEIMSNSLTRGAYYENLSAYKAENCVKILNPLSNDLNVMRQTLLFNALEAIRLNMNHRNGNLKLYELGNCYFYNAEADNSGNALARYREEYRMSMAVTGMKNTPSWNVTGAMSDFYTLRGMIEKLLARMGLDLGEAIVTPFENDLYSEAAACKLRGRRLFEMGVVSKKVRNQFDVKQEVCFMEMDFDTLAALVKQNKVAVQPLSRYPEVRRDLALLVDKAVTFGELRTVAMKTEKKLLKKVTLFDVYEGDKLPEGKKSYAIGLVLEDETKTLTDSEIDRAISAIAAQLEKQTGAKVRE